MHRGNHVIATSILICMLLPFGASSLSAQDSSKYYTVTHPDEFEINWGAFYKAMEERTAAIRLELPNHLDLAYGDDPKQKLDLYLPKGDVSNAPVFLFLHGGGFREGDRAQYGAVAEPFAAQGIITAVASYRLTGDGFSYPNQTNDTKQALKWLYDNIQTYGGDPNALYVGGHSAGAILSADIGVDRKWMWAADIPHDALKGIAPISGPYDMRRAGRPGEGNSYAPTAELQAAASPILHVGDPAPEAVIAVGSPEAYVASSQELGEKLKAAGATVQVLVLEGQDHKDTALSLANPDSELFKAVLEMIKQ